MRQDVDGFIVDIKETTETLTDGHERPVTGMYVRIELEMSRHVAPSSEEKTLRRASFLPLGIRRVHPFLIDVLPSGPFRCDDSSTGPKLLQLLLLRLLRRDVGLRGMTR